MALTISTGTSKTSVESKVNSTQSADSISNTIKNMQNKSAGSSEILAAAESRMRSMQYATATPEAQNVQLSPEAITKMHAEMEKMQTQTNSATTGRIKDTEVALDPGQQSRLSMMIKSSVKVTEEPKSVNSSEARKTINLQDGAPSSIKTAKTQLYQSIQGLMSSP